MEAGQGVQTTNSSSDILTAPWFFACGLALIYFMKVQEGQFSRAVLKGAADVSRGMVGGVSQKPDRVENSAEGPQRAWTEETEKDVLHLCSTFRGHKVC